jgi:hypothetical protein
VSLLNDRTNAIFVPSGDHTGWLQPWALGSASAPPQADAGWTLISCRPLPSACTTQIELCTSGVKWTEKTISFPCGDPEQGALGGHSRTLVRARPPSPEWVVEPFLGSGDLFDAFCSGHALTVNGTLMVAGGTESYPDPGSGSYHALHFPGLRDATIVRCMPGGYGWRATAELNHGAPKTPDSQDTGAQCSASGGTLGR